MTNEDIHALREKWTKEQTLQQLESTEERYNKLLNEHISLEKLVEKMAGNLCGFVRSRKLDPEYSYVKDLEMVKDRL